MTGPTRAIGVWGTTARIVLGLMLAGSVLHGHAVRGWHLLAWLLGLLVFPMACVAMMWLRARRNPTSLRATGPASHVINLGIFLALYLTWWYAPPVDVLSDAALLFYGGSMVLAAVRGYAGCEVLAVSNWLLRRNDQVGCAPLWPVDAVEARLATRRSRNSPEGDSGAH